MRPENNNPEDGSVSLKVGPTVLTKAHPGDIETEYDSEGMCIEE